MLNTKKQAYYKTKHMHRSFILILFCLFPSISYGLTFNLPEPENALVGKIKTAQVQFSDEGFSDIAERFDIGYYEIFEANPGVNPDHPPTGTILVVPTQYILPLELQENTVVINLAEMRLYYQLKNKVYIFPVGIGKEDWETPTGEMTIAQKTKNPTWTVPDSIYRFRTSIGEKIQRIIKPGPDNPLGSYALRLSQRKYLIHGTNLPSGVGRRSTAGCIRLYEPDIKQLYDLIEIGTRVIIINKPYKAGWHGKKLYLEAHMPLLEQRIEMGNDVQPVFDVITASIKNSKIVVDWAKVARIAREHLTIPRAIN
jgi:L,D-transpeptidase ErfK/SrfK